jgi:D-cysteine desulfhydrase
VEEETPSGAEGLGTRCVESKGFPLYDRFPGLATLPRVVLGTYPSPIERVALAGGGELWLKRDDRNAPVAAGNKVRALEFLLGPVRSGDVVLAVGGEGSTHVYATAVHAARLGARTDVIRWAHAMHPVSRTVAQAIVRNAAHSSSSRWAVAALARAMVWRARSLAGDRGRHYIPPGGSSPTGILGHVNAGLELAGQIADGQLPPPTHVVLPFGTGGTAAGLALGFGIAGVRTTIVAARVAPWIVANRFRVQSLIRQTRRLIRRAGDGGESLPAVPVVIDHSAYAGEYGRPSAAGAVAASWLSDAAIRAGVSTLLLDATYAAKAGAVALALAMSRAGASDRRVLLWVTFDGRPFVEDSEQQAVRRRAD